MIKYIIMITMVLAGSVSYSWAEKEEIKSRIKASHQKVKDTKKEHQEIQQNENQEFRQELKSSGMTMREKHRARKEHQQDQRKENQALRAKIHADKKEQLKDQFNNLERMSEEKKEELKRFQEEQNAEREEFQEQNKKEQEEFVDSVLKNENLTKEEIKSEIKKYRLGHKEKRVNFRKEGLAERRDKKKELFGKDNFILEPSMTDPKRSDY